MSSADIDFLDNIGYLGDDFGGWFMHDKLPQKLHSPESIIINLDKSANIGTHWVCLRATPEGTEYFDSYGIQPSDEIIRLMETIPGVMNYNNEKIQDLDSEMCGYFCCYFINGRMRGIPAEDLIAEMRRDSEKKIKKIGAEMKIGLMPDFPTGGAATLSSAVDFSPKGFAGLALLLAGLLSKAAFDKWQENTKKGGSFADLMRSLNFNNLLESGLLPELHAIDRADDGTIKRASFIGPGTKLKNRIEWKNGNIEKIKTPPINKLDAGAMIHDLAYETYKDLPTRHLADAELKKTADEVLATSNDWLQKLNARIVSATMDSKIKKGW